MSLAAGVAGILVAILACIAGAAALARTMWRTLGNTQRTWDAIQGVPKGTPGMPEGRPGLIERQALTDQTLAEMRDDIRAMLETQRAQDERLSFVESQFRPLPDSHPGATLRERVEKIADATETTPAA